MKHEALAVQRVLIRIINAKMAACMGTWRQSAFEMKDAKRKGTGFSNRMIKRAPTRSSASAFGKGEGRLLRTLEAVQQDLWQRLVEVSPQAIHELCPDLRHQSSDLPHRSEAALHSDPLKQQFSQDQHRAILRFELSAVPNLLQRFGCSIGVGGWLELRGC